MPIYEYRCTHCDHVTSALCNLADSAVPQPCEICDQPAARIVSRPSVHLSKTSKVEKLDPKYDKMVDRAMSNTTSADPDRYLKKARPYSEGKDG